MAEKHIEHIVEALLFSSGKPLEVARIVSVLDGVDADTVREALAQLGDYYNSQERSFHLAEIAGGYQIVTRAQYGVWINKLFKRGGDKIRGASMETLAIIVYKQPITRTEIEAIRGVNVDGPVKTLLDKNLIKVKGRKDAPGRPLLYGTTDEFLMRFGLKDLKSLPPLREFTEKDLDFGKESQDLPDNVSYGRGESVVSDGTGAGGAEERGDAIPADDVPEGQEDAYGSQETAAENRPD
ncbi:MAG: SMC-Scp complex subunit ScpB [Candidatus Omnitrophota bacterium]